MKRRNGNALKLKIIKAMPDEQENDAIEVWKKSRSGAWAGRGLE